MICLMPCVTVAFNRLGDWDEIGAIMPTVPEGCTYSNKEQYNLVNNRQGQLIQFTMTNIFVADVNRIWTYSLLNYVKRNNKDFL